MNNQTSNFEELIFVMLRDIYYKINSMTTNVELINDITLLKNEIGELKELISKSSAAVSVAKEEKIEAINNSTIIPQTTESTELIINGVNAPAEKKSLLERMKKMV